MAARISKTRLKRRRAALKGWRTRRARESRLGVSILIGYSSSKGNSYSARFTIRSRKRLGDTDYIALLERLIKEGHFDDPGKDFGVSDLSSWFVMGSNYAEVEERGVNIPRGSAFIKDFQRIGPEELD